MGKFIKMKPLSASVYNSIVNIFYNKRFLKFIQEELQPMQGLTILDVPCGTGILINCCKPSFYVGADIDINRVMDACRRNPHEDFIVSDASNLAFKNEKFDRILASGLFHHVNDSTSLKILSEFKRVLSVNGKLIVFEAIWPRNRFNLIGLVGRKLDQGKYVRNVDEYEHLFEQYFKIQKSVCFSNLGLEYLCARLIRRME
jgi:ubiquinone/menaquinone biosynthesis C-methylase UbiE